MKAQSLLFCLLATVISCSHGPVKEAQIDYYVDDLGLKNLIQPLADNIRQLEGSPQQKLKLGTIEIDKKDYLAKLRLLNLFMETNSDKILVNQLIAKLFKVVEVQSDRDNKEILLTSYYSPMIKGSKTKSEKYSFAILKKPENVNYSRSEISAKNPYQNQKLEICYLDPIEAFFLHVQGSGMVEFENGETFNLVFDGNNGRPYQSLGKSLAEQGILEKDKVTLASLETYLRSLTPAELEKTLNLNESYIFFKISEKKSLTTLGNEANPGRTIATDGALFSKGLLGYMEFGKPIFDETGKVEFIPTSRFVLDQDTGSAIKGSGRVDLFWGEGEGAKAHAGVVKEKAKLYYLVPRS
ncbi:MAG: MltA domain-containing protein [Bacteriovoracaceae bacterium]